MGILEYQEPPSHGFRPANRNARVNPAATARSLRRWAATRSRHEEDLTLKSPFSRSIAIGARSWDSAASRRRSAFSRWVGAPTWTRQQVSLAALPRGDPGAGRAGGLEPAGGEGAGREPSETPLGGDGWEAAVSVGGVLLYTDVFSPSPSQLAHNRTRPLVRHLDILRSSGLQVLGMYPTHVLLNHDLGRFRFLNAVPALLLGVDRLLLAAGVRGRLRNQLLVARRSA